MEGVFCKGRSWCKCTYYSLQMVEFKKSGMLSRVIIVYGVIGPYEKLSRVIIEAVGLMIMDSISATTMVRIRDPRP
jgi:hypothetical protein